MGGRLSYVTKFDFVYKDTKLITRFKFSHNEKEIESSILSNVDTKIAYTFFFRIKNKGDIEKLVKFMDKLLKKNVKLRYSFLRIEEESFVEMTAFISPIYYLVKIIDSKSKLKLFDRNIITLIRDFI